MANIHARSRLRHLHKSAHLLAFSSPAVAAYLESERDNLARTADIALPPVRHQQICGACGNILITGCGTSQSSDDNIRRRSSTNGPASSIKNHSIGKKTYLKCSRCLRSTNFRKDSVYLHDQAVRPKSKGATHHSIAEAVHRDLAQIQKDSDSSDSLMPINDPSHKSTAKDSRKQRAKARKQGSLQAMLVKSKADINRSQVNGDFGLDLMDLMREG